MTPVRAVHFRELRTRIDGLRGRVGLPAFAWTDRTLTPGVTPVRRVHLTDMREALAAAYEAAGRPGPAYGAGVAAGTPIRASHVTELRIAVIALEAAVLETPVSLSVSPNPVAEGSAVTVTAALSEALPDDVTVPLTLTAGTAEPGDYGSLASITIAGGQSTGTGAVTTTNDADTDDETFTVALGPLPSSVTAGSPSSVVVTIEDGDTLVSLSVSPNPVAEGSAVTVTAALSEALPDDVTVPLTLTAGTAEPGDYGSLASITIAGGQSTGTGAVTTTNDADTDDETFTVALGPLPLSLTAGSPSSVVVTIGEGDTMDRAALVALYEATAGPEWRDNTNWLTDAPIGQWIGVGVGPDGRISTLRLPGNGLTGWIPPELGKLASLRELTLRDNQLTGLIPPELGNLASLEELFLGFNDLTGPIPPELGNLASLELLFLEFNDLTGPIPPELGKLTRVIFLGLSGNYLTGPIPPELGKLTRVIVLSLSGNYLTGPIPLEIANLPNLEDLLVPGGVCVPTDLLDWAVELGVSAYPCESEGRLLPSALMREDGNGLSLALPDDLLEPSAVMVSDPSVVAVTVAGGWLELVPRGRGSADVEVVPSGGGDLASARVVVRAAVGTFGIDIVMDRPAPLSYEEGLMRGADWWSAVLDGTEWPDQRPTCFNDRATALADELLIHAWVDSRTRFAGYARPCFRESGKQGGLELDPGGGAVVAAPQSGNPFLVRHEIGHLLGLVQWSPESDLVTEGEEYFYFVGQRAVAAFRASGGDPGLPGVPFDGAHWAGSVGDFMGFGTQAEVSVAALADAGYTVDMTKPKDPPAWPDNPRAAPELGHDVVPGEPDVFVVRRPRDRE